MSGSQVDLDDTWVRLARTIFYGGDGMINAGEK